MSKMNVFDSHMKYRYNKLSQKRIIGYRRYVMMLSRNLKAVKNYSQNSFLINR